MIFFFQGISFFCVIDHFNQLEASFGQRMVSDERSFSCVMACHQNLKESLDKME